MMLRIRKPENFLAFGVVCAFLAALFVPLAFWTQRSIEFWARYAGHAKDIPYWIALVVTIVLNAIILAANIITELFRLIFT